MFSLLFFFFFKDCLKGRVRDRDLPSDGSLLRWPRQPGLGKVKARSPELHPGLQGLKYLTSTAFPGALTEQPGLDLESIWDTCTAGGSLTCCVTAWSSHVQVCIWILVSHKIYFYHLPHNVLWLYVIISYLEMWRSGTWDFPRFPCLADFWCCIVFRGHGWYDFSLCIETRPCPASSLSQRMSHVCLWKMPCCWTVLLKAIRSIWLIGFFYFPCWSSVCWMYDNIIIECEIISHRTAYFSFQFCKFFSYFGAHLCW